MIDSRPTRAKISLTALEHNFRVAKRLAGSARVMAIVKAEAYGHGLVCMAKEFSRLGADYLGVSFLEEGITLREEGITLPILVMGGLVDEQIGRYLDFNLTITVSSVWKAVHVDEVAGKRGVKASIHLKIDTGMGRVGQNWETSNVLLGSLSRLKNLRIEGIYTHFASSDSDDLTFTRTQLERFHNVLQSAHRLGIPFELVHAANSGALVQLGEEARFDMVRPGILLYGYTPAEWLAEKVDLKPVMSLLTKAVFVKKPSAGTPIGYNSTWHSPGDRWIATLPIGYGDGFPRRAGNRASVLFGGRRCPIIGNVSMDQITIDAGDEAWLGGEALLWGQNSSGSLSIWELARSIDAIPYELLCGLTGRVPRVYLV